MADRRWQYVLLLFLSIFMAFNLAGSHLRNTYGEIIIADGTFMVPAHVDQLRKEETDASEFKVSSQGYFSIAKVPKLYSDVLPKVDPMEKPLIGKRNTEPDFPIYDYELAKTADATFIKLKNFNDCIHKHMSYHELSRRKLQSANQQCLADAFTELEKLLTGRNVEELGYGGLRSGDDIWEEKGAQYVRAGRADGGGWFLVRKVGQQDEEDQHSLNFRTTVIYLQTLHHQDPNQSFAMAVIQKISALLLLVLLLIHSLGLVHPGQAKGTTITVAAGYYHKATSISADHTTATTTTPLLTTTHGPTPVITLNTVPAIAAVPMGNQFRDWIARKLRKL
ncbi:hypothetical protein BKA64DRAFT_640186 [Cadophora sp. MPI-SDFR-AT-0126]|nr:hypothetical protein BKA64DRAFT_640186 [Leotiomycetes sp. MPI-SDFR-AT-0126]